MSLGRFDRGFLILGFALVWVGLFLSLANSRRPTVVSSVDPTSVLGGACYVQGWPQSCAAPTYPSPCYYNECKRQNFPPYAWVCPVGAGMWLWGGGPYSTFCPVESYGLQSCPTYVYECYEYKGCDIAQDHCDPTGDPAVWRCRWDPASQPWPDVVSERYPTGESCFSGS